MSEIPILDNDYWNALEILAEEVVSIKECAALDAALELNIACGGWWGFKTRHLADRLHAINDYSDQQRRELDELQKFQDETYQSANFVKKMLRD